jgi:hypothetical protein
MENTFTTMAAGSAVIVMATSALYYVRYQHSKSQQLPLPPGPRRLPLLGNIKNFPRMQWYENFWRLLDTYGARGMPNSPRIVDLQLDSAGDVVYFEVFGQSTIVLGSVEVAEELLSKRANNYSHRQESFFRMDM